MDLIYGPEQQAAIAQRLDIPDQLITRENWKEHLDLLAEAEVIVSSWYGGTLNEELLNAMPHLKMYFYGAGSIRWVMTEAGWERGIRITSAASINAIPVAEFVLAQIIFSLKQAWEYMSQARQIRPGVWNPIKPNKGMFGSRVGLVGFGNIARKVAELLRPFDVEVYASTLPPMPEGTPDITFTSTEEIFKTCDVISIHLPANESTHGMIGHKLLDTMKPNATLINTARGTVIRQTDLIALLQARPDIYACLDVTDPEPPEEGSPLLDLPNAILTPHLAGSAGNECRRMGDFIVEEIDRYLAGQPLKGEIAREQAAFLA